MPVRRYAAILAIASITLVGCAAKSEAPASREDQADAKATSACQGWQKTVPTQTGYVSSDYEWLTANRKPVITDAAQAARLGGQWNDLYAAMRMARIVTPDLVHAFLVDSEDERALGTVIRECAKVGVTISPVR